MYVNYAYASFAKELVLVIEPTDQTIAVNPDLFHVEDDDKSRKEKRQLDQPSKIQFDTGVSQFGRANRRAARADTPLFRGDTPDT